MNFPHANEDMVVALDLGGTWIKGSAKAVGNKPPPLDSLEVRRWSNPIAAIESAGQYADFLAACCVSFTGSRRIRQVVISTAGEVHHSGRSYRIAAAHLQSMTNKPWLEKLEEKLACPVSLINDAEAFFAGVAQQGRLPLRGNVAAVVVGTGLGFAVVRDGRRWMPGRRLNLLGALKIPGGDYDAWASAVRAAQHASGDLAAFLATNPEGTATRYLEGLAAILASATTLYQLDKIFLGGGLSEAATAAGAPIARQLSQKMPDLLLDGQPVPAIETVERGNLTVILGALGLADGLSACKGIAFTGNFATLSTESSRTDEALETLDAGAIALRLAEAEQEAGVAFLQAATSLGSEAALIAEKVAHRGRVIYVGAGTSGRVAALDAVEIPCTFGLPREQFTAVIAGGIADAALSIEEDSEEDDASVLDLMLLQPGSQDTVVGISASGTAYFVRTALAYAGACGARTLLLHEATLENTGFCDASIRLHSGPELVRGSTRMKAGTATKKALNILSTTAMVLLGKVRSGYMIDLDPSNRKLHQRATRILADLFDISPEEARMVLDRHKGSLRDALDSPRT